MAGDVCEHGWTRINYVKCPRCEDAQRHAAEVARLESALSAAREELRGERHAHDLEKAERDRTWNQRNEWRARAEAAERERDAAREEARAAREALREIIRAYDRPLMQARYGDDVMARAVESARAVSGRGDAT